MVGTEAVTKPVKSDSTGVGQAILLYTICFILVLFVGSSVQAYSFMIGLAATLVFLLLLPAALFVRAKGVSLAAGLRLRAIRPSIVWWSFFLGVGTWGIGMLVARMLTVLGLKTLGQRVDVGLDSPMGFATSVLVTAVGAGVCEESLFRGVIQGVIERKGKWFAVIATAVLFGLFHQTLEIAIPASILGLFYGWVVIRTGSLIPAIVAHLTNNAAAMSYLYFLEAEDPIWLIPCCVFSGVVGVVAISRLSSANQENTMDSPLQKVPAGLHLWSSLGCVLPMMLFCVAMAGLVSALPYVMQAQTLTSGEQVVIADRDSLLYTPMVERKSARVLYTLEEEVAVGRIVEIADDRARIRNEEGNEVEIPEANIRGVVLSP